ncbi:hypothetical protein ABPG74_001000 [Tetrahymena malaccensis]
MIDLKDKIEKDYKNSIIQETANDFINQLLSKGDEGVDQMLQIVYGGNQNIPEEQIQSLLKFIKQNKYDDEQNVKQKLNQILNETNPKKYEGDLVLSDLFVKQQQHFNLSQQQKQDDQANIQNPDNDNNENSSQKLFSDPIKKSRIQNQKKSLYSSEVEKLIENAKKIFWDVDMERIGTIQNKQDIDYFLDSFKEELNKQQLNLTHVEIYDSICQQLGVKIIQRIDIFQLEKIVVGFVSNQTIIPLYKI